MLTRQRKTLLLDRLTAEGRLLAKPLALEFGVSEDTIRRDLRELAADGLLQRVHGGALPASPAMAPFAERQALSVPGKEAIGRAAARLVKPGQVIFLDGGTTTACLARALPRELRATVVTHSPSIAVVLAEHPAIEVVLIGGVLFKHSIVAVGAETIRAIGGIRADTVFMGVTGAHPDFGLTTGDFEEAAVKRQLVASAAETIVLASREKLGAVSPYTVARLDEIATLIVEADTPAQTIAAFAASGIGVLCA